MTAPWTQTIVISCLRDQSAFELFCEPEGAVQQLVPGDVLTIVFSGDHPQSLEISQVAGGLMLGRYGGGDVEISDKRGRDLRW